MKLNTFFKTYCFHDSLIEDVLYLPEKQEVRMSVDFCYWMQPDYFPGLQETGMIELIFSEVTSYRNFQKFYEDDVILDTHADDSKVIFCALNTEENQYYEIEIRAGSVSFES